MSFPTSPVHSKDWYDNCFGIGETEVPADIRRLSETLCNQFNIRGICDPMYIANVTAFALGRGDGRGVFHDADSDAKATVATRLAEAADRLRFAYSSTMSVSEVELRDLMARLLSSPVDSTV